MLEKVGLRSCIWPEKGVLRATRPHTTFQCECPPPDVKSLDLGVDQGQTLLPQCKILLQVENCIIFMILGLHMSADRRDDDGRRRPVHEIQLAGRFWQ